MENNKEKVVLVRCKSYNLEEVKSSILSILESLGGIRKFISPKEKILIKPNLLSARTPEEGVTTHPSVVQALAEIIIENGGIPYLGDSPSIESFHKVITKTGMKKISMEKEIKIIPFEDPVNVDFKDGEFKKLEIAKPVLEFDKIINIAKLKTHTQFILTLGVKNMFGIVPGRRKAECHIRFGNDLFSFSKFLIDLYRFKKPVITILDGIIGMDGNGPSNGRKRWFGIIMGTENAIALDTFISYSLGIGNEYSIVKAGEKMGIKGSKIEDIEVLNGELFSIPDFKLPDSIPPSTRFSFLTSRLKSSLPRPFINRELCKLCKLCIEVCQTDSIKEDSKGLKIDYKNCISCFCCQEVCPYNAIEIKRGLLGKILRRI
jgi:uncharacterized protein (DUF362 family)/Pyruvate/2-oxoacid:ferredoxin oxidoreductase delta subunit